MFVVGLFQGCGDTGEKTPPDDASIDGSDDGSNACGDGVCGAGEDAVSCPTDCASPAECGNGIPEEGEECDDGNDVDGDGCDADCTFSCVSDADCAVDDPCLVSPSCDLATHVCGEVTAVPNEPPTACGENDEGVCFDGACAAACLEAEDCPASECTGPATCHELGVCVYDAVPEDGTACALDEGGEGICLDRACVPSVCGDGFVDAARGEECEPPGSVACDESCIFVGECRADEECADGGDFCAGATYCDLDTYTCESAGAPADGTPCGLGELDVCVAGTCTTVACTSDAHCASGDVCVDDGVCDLGTFTCVAGAVKPDGASCDDVDDRVCLEGDCVAVECRTDDDCDDGNACNGFESCNQATFTCTQGVSEPNGASCEGGVCLDGACIAPDCQSDADCVDDNPCTTGESCNLSTFTCNTPTPRPDGTQCGATDRDVCIEGVCDTVACTSNVHCDDGEFCTGSETCDTSTFTCVPGTPPGNGATCGSGRVCLDEACVVAGCTTDADCDDGNACTTGEHCDLSTFTCVEGTLVADGTQCGALDRDVCIAGACERVQCVSNAQCADTNACNGAETCDLSSFTCQPGTNLPDGTECGDSLACLNGACISNDFCLSDADCSDGNACNGAEVCNLATNQCQPGTPLSNGTQCGATELDVCVNNACVNVDCTSNAHCNDGLVCNGAETCNLSTFTCVSGSAAPNGTSCGADERDVCVGGACQSVQCTVDAHCDDGNACNGTETCGANFQCQAGTPVANGTQCGPSAYDVCIAGACTFGVECLDHADCDDGNVCTGTETCGANYQCQAGTPLANGTQCGATALDVCVDLACTPVQCTNAGHCNDGNACNGTETCSNFACQPGTPLGTGASCGGSNRCNADQQCVTPECTTDANCSDGNVCNGTETCDPDYFVCEAGTPPADGTSCGTGMVCEAGSCVSSQRFCTAVYSLSPRMIIEGTTGGFGDGTFPLPNGSMTIRYEANAGTDTPKAGGAVEVLHFWIRNEFVTGGGALIPKLDTKVNMYTPRCGGQTTTAWNPAPTTCPDDGNTTPIALGTYTGTQIQWTTCNAHPDWGSSTASGSGSYEYTDVSTGPGCFANVRSVGNVHCTNASFGNCSLGGLSAGNNQQDATWTQPMHAMTLNAAGTALTIAKTNIPNDKPSRTYIDATGTRASVTCD